MPIPNREMIAIQMNCNHKRNSIVDVQCITYTIVTKKSGYQTDLMSISIREMIQFKIANLDREMTPRSVCISGFLIAVITQVPQSITEEHKQSITTQCAITSLKWHIPHVSCNMV